MEKAASEITRDARLFVKKWTGRGREKQDDKTFWEDLLEDVFGIARARDTIEVQKPVQFNGTTKFIDIYIKTSKVVIEQKSLGVNLDTAEEQSDKTPLTPMRQGKRYYDWLDKPQQGRYIVACNFGEFRIFDTYHKSADEKLVKLEELPKRWRDLSFLVQTDEEAKAERGITEEAVARTASEYVHKLYKCLINKRKNLTSEELHSLNVFCVRVVFCLFAEEAGLFGDRLFRRFIEKFDADELGWRFGHLWEILDDKCRTCCRYAPKELMAFPYVDGGLFKHDDRYATPPITKETRDLLLSAWQIKYPKTGEPFYWSDISPTNFGCIFESTTDQAVRASGGMHYTTPDNIHRVIGPLFLDDLRRELQAALLMPTGTKEQRATKLNVLEEYRQKLSSLRFLDPACGSGNFLTETYRSLHELELEAIKAELNLNFQTYTSNIDPCKVQISQFYGIEIDDFAASVAKASLWIAECQMLQKTEEVLECRLEMLPLPKNANITCVDALTTDWNQILRPGRSNPTYIVGNPPFQGYSVMTAEQKQSLQEAMPSTLRGKPLWSSQGKMDFVCGWYAKAAEYMRGTSHVKAAFVSTNSITQGEQTAWLWKPLMKRYGLHIDFAWRAFRWDNEAEKKARVHCVIIGFSNQAGSGRRYIYEEGHTPLSVSNVNGYLLGGEDLFIESRTKPLGDVPEMVYGNKPVDGGFLILEPDERQKLIEQEPEAEPYVRRLLGAREFLHGEERYCLWLTDALPRILKLPPIKERIDAVKRFRQNSAKADTRQWADLPYRFVEIRQPETEYILVPSVTSEGRKYVPMGFVGADVISSNANLMIPSPTLWLFGILQSRLHMAWLKYVCGRLETRYRYSANIVYNNFPFCELTPEQLSRIEQTSQAIIDVRKRYEETSLADMYDVMKEDLLRAHQQNDRVVAEAFGIPADLTDEEVAMELMRRSVRMAKARDARKLSKKKKTTK